MQTANQESRNNRDINSNGRLIRNFISSNDLRIVNSDAKRCKGLFTRITHNSVSALDLVLEDDKDDPLVTEMSIDTFGEILGGNDHSAIFYKLKIKSGPSTKEPQEEDPIVGPNQATGEAYREAFEALVFLADWSPMDTGEKCRFLQDTLVAEAKISCNQKPVRNTRISVCKSMRRLRKKCIVAEAQARQLEHEKAVLGFGSDESKKGKEKLLQFFKQEAVTLRLQIKEKTRQRLLLRRLHARSTLTNKQFWRLVRRTVKKKGLLSAIKDTQGKLATDRAWIEEIVLEELAKIFSGQRSAIFTHRGEQLIKEMDVKQLMGWQEWMKDTVVSTTHEEQVCRRTTDAEVKAVIDKMKLQQSPGVDNVTVAMLKYAGPCFVNSVNRELLYAKLDTIGFGGKVKSLIQSMYYNDSLRVRIKGGLMPPLWFTKHAMKEGINFNGQVISALFFADDLVLISWTKVSGMERMLREVSRFCHGVYMKLSVKKTIILSNGTQGQAWKIEPGTPDLESNLVGKYLGVELQVKGRNLVKLREERMVCVKIRYHGSHKIWTRSNSSSPYPMGEMCYTSYTVCGGIHGVI